MNDEATTSAGAAAEARCPDYSETIVSLLDLLRHQMERWPDRVVLNSIRQGRTGLEARPLSVAELVGRANQAAAVLRDCGVGSGDRVILSLSDPQDFTIAFFGALTAGAAAVPLPTVVEAGAPASFASRVRSVCADCDPKVAIVEGAKRYTDTVGDTGRTHRTLEPSQLSDAAPIEASSRSDGGSTAFIQYTSGSTGTPKGVVVTHANILANCRAIRDATEYRRDDRMVTWIPLHHDMGLIGGLLTSIYCAAPTWMMPPMTFLARPATWLQAMTEYRATLTVAPTFAYSLCARKLPDKQMAGVDLKSLRLAYIGAEPVDRATLEAFEGRLAPYGLRSGVMYPVYGLAEATLAAAFPRPGAPLRYDSVDRAALAARSVAVPTDATDQNRGVATFVSVGHELPRHHVEIVVPGTSEVLGERQVGELTLVGESVTPRYYRDSGPDRTRLHTGDLAYRADGHVYIVDRIKDLVIVAGQSHAPSDIENAVAELDDVRRGRIVAFSSLGDAGTECLHIVAEMSPRLRRFPTDLEARVRRQVQQNTGLVPTTVTLVAPGSLERTSSGKIKRKACASSYTAGTLEVVRGEADLMRIRIQRDVQSLSYRLTSMVKRILRGRGADASR